MHELARITLQNEMDLIIVHRRSMKLAELAGLSLSAQTTFATAVSEVSRSAIEHGKNGCLILNVSNAQKEKYIIARIIDEEETQQKNEGLEYAKRLVNKYNISTSGKETSIELYYYIPSSVKLDIKKLDEWKMLFRNEPPISPYEEIKRKNEQLQNLAQKLQESENQYKTLTNALPIIIFSLDAKGDLLYANEWLSRFTGFSPAQLNATKWKQVVHPDDYDTFSTILNPALSSGALTIKTQCRLRHKNEKEYYWHLASISPLNNDKGVPLYWIGYFVDINAQKLVEQTLQDNKELKEAQAKLKENQAALESNIAELNRSNQELQQFAYVASHDLQEPIRKISFYGDYMLNKYADALDAKGLDYLKNMMTASTRMRSLIHDLLSFSQVEKGAIEFKQVNLTELIQQVVNDLDLMNSEKQAQIQIADLPSIEADEGMMRQLFENLIGNALKYSKDNQTPVIRIAGQQINDKLEITIEDNGIGFDEKYLPKMFALFQRLHSTKKYKGTGLGLAICKKIIALHGGTISASAKVMEGATFKVTLPVNHIE